MNEIKIEEQRFLSLIKSEEKLHDLLGMFITYLLDEWKKTNIYHTVDDRKIVITHLQNTFKSIGITKDIWFNNNYCNCIMFDTPYGLSGIKITEINHSTGESINTNQ